PASTIFESWLPMDSESSVNYNCNASSNSAKLAEMLLDAGADVTYRTLPVGHQLSQADLVLTREWLERVKKRTLQSA
ncbi:hypothetical protein AAFX91_40045, partial [Bradyrhizobium sp. 31Argb]